MRSWIWFIVKWGLAVGLIAILVWINRAALADTLSQWDQSKPEMLLLSAALFFFGLCFTFVRWWVLVRAQELPFRIRDAARLNFVSLFFSLFLPGAVGGDLVKAGFLAQEQQRRTVAIATILVDRLIGLYGLFVLAAACGLYFQGESWIEEPTLQAILIVCWAVALGVPALVFLIDFLPIDGERMIAFLRGRGRVGIVFGELVRALHLYRRRLSALGLATLLAIIGHVGFVSSFYFGACSLPKPVPGLQPHAVIVPSVFVFQAIPIFPGGWGGAELATEELYRQVGAEYRGLGVPAVWANRLVNYAWAFLGLLLYLPLRKRGGERRMPRDGPGS